MGQKFILTMRDLALGSVCFNIASASLYINIIGITMLANRWRGISNHLHQILR